MCKLTYRNVQHQRCSNKTGQKTRKRIETNQGKSRNVEFNLQECSTSEGLASNKTWKQTKKIPNEAKGESQKIKINQDKFK